MFRLCLLTALVTIAPWAVFASDVGVRVFSSFGQPIGIRGRSLTLKCTVSWDGGSDAYKFLPPVFESPQGLEVVGVSSLVETKPGAERGRFSFSQTFSVHLSPTTSGVVESGPGEISYSTQDGSSQGVISVPSANIRVIPLPVAVVLVLVPLCVVLLVPLVVVIKRKRAPRGVERSAHKRTHDHKTDSEGTNGK